MSPPIHIHSVLLIFPPSLCAYPQTYIMHWASLTASLEEKHIIWVWTIPIASWVAVSIHSSWVPKGSREVSQHWVPSAKPLPSTAPLGPEWFLRKEGCLLLHTVFKFLAKLKAGLKYIKFSLRFISSPGKQNYFTVWVCSYWDLQNFTI